MPTRPESQNLSLVSVLQIWVPNSPGILANPFHRCPVFSSIGPMADDTCSAPIPQSIDGLLISHQYC